MLKDFVIAPDSFKGTLEAEQVCDIIADSIRRYIPDAVIHKIPMSDGGEGLVNAYVRLLGGEKRHLSVCGPEGEPVLCEFGLLPSGTTVIEMASCAGLTLLKQEKDPFCATTYGVGQLLRFVEASGWQDVLLGLGGSATNDLGIGMAAALGYRFLDETGDELSPYLYNFHRIHQILPPEHKLNLRITVACDVDNPLCGPNGATFTFGPQKGVPEERLLPIDESLRRVAGIMEKDLGVSVLDIPGGGAAGGLGAGLVAFTGARLQTGIDMLMDAVGFDQLLKQTDMVFTGEGCIDWQSSHGKVPVGVARRAKQAGVPCIALCGSVGSGAELAYETGITAIFSSVMGVSDFETVKQNSKQNMAQLSDSVMRLLTWRESGRKDR